MKKGTKKNIGQMYKQTATFAYLGSMVTTSTKIMVLKFYRTTTAENQVKSQVFLMAIYCVYCLLSDGVWLGYPSFFPSGSQTHNYQKIVAQ